MTRTSVSVVINTLDRAAHLRTALRALEQLRYPAFEVIVVNGPSRDDTEAVLDGYGDRIKRARCPEANLSMSRNIGIGLAAGDVVAFLDDDAIPEPDWLDELVRGYEDPGVGAVGGFLRDHTGVTFQCRVTVCDRFGDSEGFDTVEAAGVTNKPGDWRFLSPTGANSSFRRSALLAVGGFDETFAYFLDETDVNLRILDAGWTIAYQPAAEVHHKYAPSALRDHRKVPSTLYMPARSKAYFSFRWARPQKRFDEILGKLSAYVIDIRGHNRWFGEHEWVTKKKVAQLDEDLARGVRDGASLALGMEPAPLLSPARMNRQADRLVPFYRAPSSEPLRLAFVSQQYPPGTVGGVGVWTAVMARGLAARGHEVTVVTASTSGQNTVDFEHGVWVHRIVPVWSPNRREPALPDLPQSLKDHLYAVHDEIERITSGRGLDLVSWPIWDLEGLAVQSAGHLPTVMSLHTTYGLALPSKPDWSSREDYMRDHVGKIIAAESGALNGSPFVLANSDQIVADLSDLHALDLNRPGVAHIPHGLPDASREIKRGRLDDGKIRLLFVGRLEARKGVDVLLAALPALLAKHAALEVVICGDDTAANSGGGHREAFQTRHRWDSWHERVTFAGLVTDEVLRQHYADCDLFVAPSRYESFGLIFLEAMMFAKPCIGTRIGGIAEVVEDEVTGLLVGPGDVESLSRAIDRLVEDAKLRHRLGKAGRARYVDHFTADLMVEAAEAYYGDIIGKAQSNVGRGRRVPA
jgi:glycosyltransferase involved in cell wall biosynthesis/GT2 family glycosyltransferase